MRKGLLQLLALAGAAVSLFATVPADGAVRPFSAATYAVQAKCPPPTPGHASCLSLGLVRRHRALRLRKASPTTISPALGQVGYRPSDLHSAYSLPTEPASAQTIALVDAYNDLSAKEDLETYDKEFGLSSCKCFSKVGQTGSESSLPFPKSKEELSKASKAAKEEAIGWGGEIALDVETAHAICQTCHILLVEANSSEYSDLEAAETTAVSLGATEVSNSWGGSEEGIVSDVPFNHPGTVITASAGDAGYLDWAELPEEGPEFPASSPHVVAVGGTRLEVSGPSSTWAKESVWNGDGAGGGGCSLRFAAPAWQQSLSNWSSIGCGTGRSVSDVSADADPYTGVAVRYTGGGCSFEAETAPKVVETIEGWCPVGGTSLASPLIASTFALAGGAGAAEYPAQTLYENEQKAPAALHDVTAGSNGECLSGYSPSTGLSACTAIEEAQASCSTKVGSCLACVGYDGPTGVGTPKGIEAFAHIEGAGAGPASYPACELPKPASKEGPATTPPAASPPPPVATQAQQPPPSPPAAPLAKPRISRLRLTNAAMIALNRSHPRISQVRFAFTLTLRARVRIAFSKRVRRHGRWTWAPAASAATVSAAAGQSSRSLGGRKNLTSGLYRLTITPVNGVGRSLSVQIG